MNSGIYRIVNVATNKTYFGRTHSPEHRRKNSEAKKRAVHRRDAFGRFQSKRVWNAADAKAQL
jgi:hypothetical protein